MNKTQTQYLLQKLNALVQERIDAFAKAHPVRFTQEEVASALRKAGFVVAGSTYDYVVLPPTSVMKTNVAKREAHSAKLKQLRRDTEDQINLGDNKDALDILASFTAALAKVK